MSRNSVRSPVDGHGRHNTDTELGFYRGYQAGYIQGGLDQKSGKWKRDYALHPDRAAKTDTSVKL